METFNEALHEAGVQLKKARLERGISLQMVHEATKIPIDSLKGLEEGYTTRTLSPFYQKGFLKIYAKYLEVDIREMIKDVSVAPPVQSVEEPPSPSPSMPSFQKPSLPDFGEIKERIKEVFPPERLAFIGKFLGLCLILFMIFRMGGCLIHKMSNKPKHLADTKVVPREKTKTKKEKPVHEREAASAVSKPTPPPVAVAEIKPPEPTAPFAVTEVAPVESKPSTELPPVENIVPTAVPVVQQESEQTPQKNVILSIRAPKNIWLLVKVDGKIVFQGTFKKGVTKTWSGDQEIELSGKNVNLLEFEVNGKMIGTLGREGHRAKTVVVTKDGLSVQK